MRWFGGFAPRKPVLATSVPALRPDGVRQLWGGPAPLWLAGRWSGHEIRTARIGDRLVAVIGPCGITQPELQGLATARVEDDALARWPGSYTIIEVAQEGTTIWTDLGSAFPIYIVDVEDGTVWASSSRALAPLASGQNSDGVDLSWLAAVLLVPSAPELLAGRSAFADVTAVAPGHRLMLPVEGPRSQWPAWQPARPDHIEFGEAACRLRSALYDAVKVRAAFANCLSADCSGGLDSTSLTLLAAELIDDGRKVQAVTVHPAEVSVSGDLKYALEATRGNPRIGHHLLPLAAEHTPYSRLDLLPATDEPAPTTITISRVVAQYDLLRALGSDCHLTGDGGDTILGGHPRYLVDLARAGRFGRLAKDAMGWARLRGGSMWPVLAEIVRASRTTRAAWLRALADMVAAIAPNPRDGPRPSPGFAGWHATSGDAWWATPGARLMAAGVARAAADAADYPDSSGAGCTIEEETVRTLAAIQAVGRTAHADAQVARAFGVNLHNPFTDTLVIDACLAVPTWERMSPHAYKPLLVAAMTGLLPPAVAARGTKGDFTPDHYLGLRANADRLHALADGRLAAIGLVDPPELRRAIAHAGAGLPVDFSTFEPVIAAEVWLGAVAVAPPVRWQRQVPPPTAPLQPSHTGLSGTERVSEVI